MGVTISSEATTAPIFFASTIIGFVSFALTAATTLRVFWENLETIKAAPREIDDYLGSLKVGLYEEREHVKMLRKHIRRRGSSRNRGEKGGSSSIYAVGDIDGDVSTKVARDSLRHMIRSFHDIERPFLRYPHEKSQDEEGYWESERDDFYHTDYRECGLRERWLWLHRKQSVVTMLQSLSRIETRRMANEMGDVHYVIRSLGRNLEELEERLLRIEQRMTRIVGVRRVE